MINENAKSGLAESERSINHIDLLAGLAGQPAS